MVNFSDALAEAACVADRLERLIGASPITEDRMGLLMDLMAADGQNGNPPLDWQRLQHGNPADCIHDVLGIYKHLDRTTGRLGGGFLPRHAVIR